MSENRQGRVLFFPRMTLFFHVNKTALIIRGLFFLVLGLIGLFRPIGSIAAVTIILGVLLLIDALTALFVAVVCRMYSGIFWTVLLCAAGILSIVHPFWVDRLWMMLLGFWLVVTGVGEILSTKGAEKRGGLLFGSGIGSILIGSLLASLPFLGLLAAAEIVSAILILAGMGTLFLVGKMKSAPSFQDAPDALNDRP